MYRKFKFDEKIKFVECRILWKLIGKLCTFNRQKVQIHRRIQLLRMYNIMKIQWKTQYFRCTARPDSWGKKKKKHWLCWMYEIAKIQRKIECIRWTEFPNTWRISNSLNARYHENSCTFDEQNVRIREKKLNSWNVQNCQNSKEN